MTRSAVAIGNFDGVHLGHQAILESARQAGGDAPVAAVTFWPHPLTVIDPSRAPDLLTRLDQRCQLLRDSGAETVTVVPFTDQVSQWTPEEFVAQIIAPLNPCVVVVGKNFRFGYRAAGDGADLLRYGHDSFDVVVRDMFTLDGAPVSSSRIRQQISTGAVSTAWRMLGRPFSYSGTVQVGDQRGRTLGFPTANLSVEVGQVTPADGVYAGRLHCDGEVWPAAISVGQNPTFAGQERRIESHVLDRVDLDLYGRTVTVEFGSRLRGQLTFAGPDELVRQMRADCEQTRSQVESLFS
jgi:riboflavin kinase/FMN adenylyltransferase